jgi:CxxC motif-containing protein (DUF1111 family)
MVSRRLTMTLAAAPLLLSAHSFDAAIGEKLFERNWGPAPSSTTSDDGLGPLYNATSCAACHGARAGSDSVPPGTVIRLGNAKGGGDPVYGAQLQPRAVPGQMPEGMPDIAWRPQATLRVPAISISHPAYGPFASTTRMGLRRAPPLSGVGALAAVPAAEIIARAEVERETGDGVAGRVAWIDRGGTRVLGRFGWKATEPDLAAQTSLALSRDIGLSTRAHDEPWGDCTPAEKACRAGPHGAAPGAVEVPDSLVRLIVAYLAARPAPDFSHADAAGSVIFARIGCAECHGVLHRADGALVPAYTDLLLHAMGPGLDDGIADGAAKPGEWRTAPLWNVAASLKTGGLLHDGRARGVAEAIAWHDGEAAKARAHFRALSASDAAALVAFVGGL